jgi:hypothetical protein
MCHVHFHKLWQTSDACWSLWINVLSHFTNLMLHTEYTNNTIHTVILIWFIVLISEVVSDGMYGVVCDVYAQRDGNHQTHKLMLVGYKETACFSPMLSLWKLQLLQVQINCMETQGGHFECFLESSRGHSLETTLKMTYVCVVFFFLVVWCRLTFSRLGCAFFCPVCMYYSWSPCVLHLP